MTKQQNDEAPGELGPRGQSDFVGHVRIPAEAVDYDTPINNVIAKAKTDRGKWLEDATELIGPTRAEIRSTYIRWALAINGLHVAAERYRDEGWQGTHAGFYVTSIRANHTGQGRIERIAQWDGETAASNHLVASPMLVAYGMIDLYACLEECVFKLHRAYLNEHPDRLLQGDEFKSLRKLRNRAAACDEAKNEWQAAWQKRCDEWQRKRIYDGLHKVFLALFADTGMAKPKAYKNTSPESWAESIRLVAVLRNSLMHGATEVSAELASLTGKPYSLGFDLKEGDRLSMELIHLQSIECFLDQLLNAVNLSLVEHPDAFS